MKPNQEIQDQIMALAKSYIGDLTQNIFHTISKEVRETIIIPEDLKPYKPTNFIFNVIISSLISTIRVYIDLCDLDKKHLEEVIQEIHTGVESLKDKLKPKDKGWY